MLGAGSVGSLEGRITETDRLWEAGGLASDRGLGVGNSAEGCSTAGAGGSAASAGDSSVASATGFSVEVRGDVLAVDGVEGAELLGTELDEELPDLVDDIDEAETCTDETVLLFFLFIFFTNSSGMDGTGGAAGSPYQISAACTLAPMLWRVLIDLGSKSWSPNNAPCESSATLLVRKS